MFIKAKLGGTGMDVFRGIDVGDLLPETLFYTNDFKFFIAGIKETSEIKDRIGVHIISEDEYNDILSTIRLGG